MALVICQACSEQCYTAFYQLLSYEYYKNIAKMTKNNPGVDTYINVIEAILSNNSYNENDKRYVCEKCLEHKPLSLFGSYSNQANHYMKSAQLVFLFETLMLYRHKACSPELLYSSFGATLVEKLNVIKHGKGVERMTLSYRWKGADYYKLKLYPND